MSSGLLAAFAKLDNVVVDMPICDALQDEDFSRRAGYERTASAIRATCRTIGCLEQSKSGAPLSAGK